jgi:hypothetical protein
MLGQDGSTEREVPGAARDVREPPAEVRAVGREVADRALELPLHAHTRKKYSNAQETVTCSPLRVFSDMARAARFPALLLVALLAEPKEAPSAEPAAR